MSDLTLMSMPETAMDENDGPVPRKHDVWTTGQVFPVEPESKSSVVKQLPNQDLWSSIPAADCCHIPASPFSR